ncbi:hypothetical protein B0A53_01401 [Rhodotorula sp. CCFEE 5036]|nr:hypothetical protein B0A53_01401 [Rhodotorula sp. CCFEE 5036]
MHRKLFKPSHAATSSTSKALPDDKVKEIARAIALKAERDYSNLLAAAQHATHHHKEATDSLKNLLDQILQDTHTAADGHPRKEAVWICAVWIKLQHSHDIHQVNAVAALQYVKEDYEQGYALSVDERELSPKEKAELSHDALQETCTDLPYQVVLQVIELLGKDNQHHHPTERHLARHVQLGLRQRLIYGM